MFPLFPAHIPEPTRIDILTKAVESLVRTIQTEIAAYPVPQKADQYALDVWADDGGNNLD